MYLPPGFDQPLAQEAAKLVIEAYRQYKAFKNGTAWDLQGNYDFLGAMSAKPAGLFTKLEPFGLVARGRATGRVFVVFRGTESLSDWLSDFTFPQRPHAWGQVADGFGDLYEQCSADVRALVGRSAQPGGPALGPVIVTGHSLGAALAILACADLIVSKVAAEPVMYTFAGPRIGDLRFAGMFNKRVSQAWRVANTEDIVPTLPLPSVTMLKVRGLLKVVLLLARKLQYEHVGAAVSFTVHKGTIPDNHAIETYLAAIQ